MKTVISCVVPFFNEEHTLVDLFERIDEAVRPLLAEDERYEVVYVDDGSTDGSADAVEELASSNPEVRLLQLRGNFGKSAALAAGFAHSRGRYVVTLDADLQDDPKEIPRLINKLREGYDLVSGYKAKRHDSWDRVVGSRIFNLLVRLLTGVPVHDVNCGFKAYREVVVRTLRLYGDLHRFIPVLAAWNRFRFTEIEVEHHERRFGKSKYGPGRGLRGVIDLVTVFFLLKYDRRPAQFFAKLGGLSTLAGVAICAYLSTLWFQGEAIGQRPLLNLGVLLIVVGIQILCTGLIAELVVHVAGSAEPYRILRILDGRSERSAPGSEGSDREMRSGGAALGASTEEQASR